MQTGAAVVDLSVPSLRPPSRAIATASSSDTSPDLRGQAHDINNKLTAVVGFAELLLRPGVDSQKVSVYADKIHRAATSCAAIAKAMLVPRDVPLAGSPPVDLHQVILDELGLVAGDLLRQGINLHADLAPGHPRVRMDATELGRVTANLVDNARDALLADPVFAKPRDARIVVSTTTDPAAGTVRLCVQDNGPGISEEFQERVWRDGFSTKAVSTESRRGFGLAVVRSLVERAGGRVELESAPGQGTAFRLFLPGP